jgi:restriction endonuclease S subunit
MVMFYDEYSSEVFRDYLQSLPLSDFVQSGTAQMNNYAIVQVETAQLPAILYLTTFTNHIEILNRCKTIEQRIFYILYAYRERLKKLDIPLPPKDEQQAIVAYIEEKCEKIDKLASELQSEIDYLKEYKQRLIADCVTGQVNVQNEMI